MANSQWDGHRNTWFAPDRPVDGTTVYVRPAGDVMIEESAEPEEGDES